LWSTFASSAASSGCSLAYGLDREGAEPFDEERAVVRSGYTRRPRTRTRWDHLLEFEDSLPEASSPGNAVPAAPGFRERLDLRCCTDGARQFLVDAGGEGLDRSRRERLGEHDSVRRGAQRSTHHGPALLDEPEAVFWIAPRMLFESPEETEREVVSRLVSEQQIRGATCELGHFVELEYVHRSSVVLSRQCLCRL